MAMVSINPPGGVAPDPGAKVLKAGDHALLVGAEEALAAAGRQAEAIVEKAKADAEELRRRGHEEGVAEGKAEVAGQLLEAVTASVEQMANTENALVDVVVKSLRTILGTFDREELAAQVVGHALRLVRDEKRVVLRVAPADAEAVERRLADIVRGYPGMGRVDIAVDAGLSPGGCVMETEIGVIDATLERQLSIIEETFRRHLEERQT